MRRYEELRADPDEWASYQAEARLTDNAAGDGLPNARAEYPEPFRSPGGFGSCPGSAGSDAHVWS